MNRETNNHIQDIQFRYELSLSIGQSLELKENCSGFFKWLIEGKGLRSASVFIRDCYLQTNPSQEKAVQVYSSPETHSQEKIISTTHPLFLALEGRDFAILSPREKDLSLLLHPYQQNQGVMVMGNHSSLKVKTPKILIVDDSKIMRLIVWKQLEPEAIIIMVSAMGQRTPIYESMTWGAKDFVIKPIVIDRLLSSIHHYLPLPIPQKSGIRPGKEKEREIRILLAEDQPMSQKLIRSLLEKKGWEVSCVNNGREALEIIEKIEFHLILMDIEMPELNGYEAARGIRELEKKRHGYLPIMALTADEGKQYQKRVKEAGMDHLLAKPVQAETFYEIIEELLKSTARDKRKGMQEKTAPPLDIEKMQAELGNDEVIQEILAVFCQELPGVLEHLKEGVKKKDAPTISRLAHGLKGELENLRAKEAYHLVS